MPTLEQRIAKLEQVILNGLGTPQLLKLTTVENNASFPFYSTNEKKLVRIEYSDLINLLGSGGIVFEQESAGDPPESTGRIIIKQNGVQKVIIGKTAQSNQYSDLDGKPSFATETYVDLSYNNLLNILNTTTKYKGDFDVSVPAPVLIDASGTIGHEYKVIGAAPAGTVFNFGSGDITLNNDDIIAHNGTTWFKKVDNNPDLSPYQLLSEKGVANGYVSLNSSSKIDTAFLPSYVDDVLEFTNLAGFPATGETGKIYIALDTEFTYRWSGSAYVHLKDGNFEVKKTIVTNTGTAYTIASIDANRLISFTDNTTVNVTVDTGSLSEIGDTAQLDYQGTGTLNIVAGTATLHFNPNRLLQSDGQYSRIAIQKKSATEYRVFGELAIA